VNYFRPYLYGRKFTIITDHKPLIWLHSIQDPSSRLWKWRTKLAEYDFEIKYKKETLNSNTDALSRNPVETQLYPLVEVNEENSSDESIYSFNQQNQNLSLVPYNKDNQVNPSTNIPPSHNSDYLEMAPLRKYNETIIEEILNSESEENIITDSNSGSDDSECYEEIIEPVSVPYEKIPLIPKDKEISIQNTRENLLNRKDHVIFIHLNGTPFDTGSDLYAKANLLPKYENLTYERANVRTVKSNTLISIPIKFNNRTLVEPQT